MKHIFALSLLIVLINGCYSQKNLPKEKQSDVFVLDNRDDFSLVEHYPNKLAIKDEKHLVFFQEWLGYGGGDIDKEYVFYKNKDTMVVRCNCGQAYNAYFKNFKFQKGKFNLKDDSKNKIIKGRDISTSKNLQNIIIKNVNPWDGKGNFLNYKYQDIKFREIDLLDTINVHLKKVEKFSELWFGKSFGK